MPFRPALLCLIRALILAVAGLGFASAAQALTLDEALAKTPASTLFQGAEAYGAPQGSPAIVPVLQGTETLGYAYLASDFTASTGYSGKPIHILVGIDPTGVVRGLSLIEHHEPIVLIGIPEEIGRAHV